MGKKNNDTMKEIAEKYSPYSIGCAMIYLKVAEALKLTIGFCGAHGRAKTAIFNQFAEQGNYDEVCVVNLSQQAPEDMIGLPVNKDYDGSTTVTAFSNPEWFQKACDPNRKVILFFDEFTNGEDDVQAAILKLIDERESNGMKITDDTLIAMAFNPPSIAPNARSLSKATRDRICVIPIEDADKNPYKDYFKKSKKSILATILEEIPEFVADYTEEVRECAYENAEFTYRSMEHAYDICQYITDNKLPESIMRAMCRGYGGMVMGDTFSNYFKENYVSSATNDLIKKIAKNASTGIEVYEGITNEVGFDFDNASFDELFHVANLVEANAKDEVFNEFCNTTFSQEFMVAYYKELDLIS